jgi:hypothetical protein
MVSRADYHRQWRATRKQLQDRKAERRGVELAVKLLRLTVGHASVTGVEAAQMIERTLLIPVPTTFVVKVGS